LTPCSPSGSQLFPLRRLPPLAGRLSGGGVEPVEDVDQTDLDDQCRKGRLVVVPGGLIPDLVGYRVGPITER